MESSDAGGVKVEGNGEMVKGEAEGAEVRPLPFAKPPAVKRPRWVEESGVEEAGGDDGSEELWKFVRISHAALAEDAGREALLGEAKGEAEVEAAESKGAMSDGEMSAEDGGAEGDAEKQVEVLRNPQEVIDLLVQAKGDADVLVDLVGQVEGDLWLRPQHVTPPEVAPEVRHRRAAVAIAGTRERLGGLARMLRSGAAALRTFAAQDDHFYTDLARLQRNWSIELTQARGRRQSIFQADISVAQVAPPINILKDEAGHICIEVETRVVVVGGALGEVRVRPVLGLHAIHDTLGTMQREQWWRDITDMLAYEVARREDIPKCRVEEVIRTLTGAAAAPSVTAFRIVVERGLLTSLAPHAHNVIAPTPIQTPLLSHSGKGRAPLGQWRKGTAGGEASGRQQSSAWRWPATVSLEQRRAVKFMGLMDWLRHRAARDRVFANLAQAAGWCPGTAVFWVGCSGVCTSAVRAGAGAGGGGLLFIVKGEQLLLDGVLDGSCDLQWARACMEHLGRAGFQVPRYAALTETGAETRQEEQVVFINNEMLAEL